MIQKLGYGPAKRLAVTLSTRSVSGYRDAAVILIDQLKEIYIDGQLETIDTTQWYPRIMRKDFTVGLNVSESAVDDPDQQFYENYVCTAERNYTGYCSPEVDRLVDQQSAESDKEKRKQLVWEIEKRLAQDGARPVIFYPRQATCRHPQVKGMTMMVNSIYNGYRYEDLWLANWALLPGSHFERGGCLVSFRSRYTRDRAREKADGMPRRVRRACRPSRK